MGEPSWSLPVLLVCFDICLAARSLERPRGSLQHVHPCGGGASLYVSPSACSPWARVRSPRCPSPITHTSRRKEPPSCRGNKMSASRRGSVRALRAFTSVCWRACLVHDVLVSPLGDVSHSYPIQSQIWICTTYI